jgi:hypothetical protein
MLDPWVLDAEPIQLRCPLLKVFSSVYQELQVIEAGTQLAETLPLLPSWPTWHRTS